MSWHTYFEIGCVQYCTTADPHARVSNNDVRWKSANVHISEVTANTRWLGVFVQGDPVPAIWQAVAGSWKVNCEERSLTVTLRNLAPEASNTVHKIRFQGRAEFWSFVAHIVFARVQAYNLNNWGAGSTSAAEEAMTEEQVMTEG